MTAENKNKEEELRQENLTIEESCKSLEQRYELNYEVFLTLISRVEHLCIELETKNTVIERLKTSSLQQRWAFSTQKCNTILY